VGKSPFIRRSSLGLWLAFLTFLLLLRSQGGTSSGLSSQKPKCSEEEVRACYRIDAEDPIEAGLIEQQLKIKTEMVLHSRVSISTSLNALLNS
jgi:hypothetical protein